MILNWFPSMPCFNTDVTVRTSFSRQRPITVAHGLVSRPTVSRTSTRKYPPGGRAVVGAVGLQAFAERRVVGVVYWGTYEAWPPSLRGRLRTEANSSVCAIGNNRIGSIPQSCRHGALVLPLCSAFLPTPFLLWASSRGRRVLEFKLCHSGEVGTTSDINETQGLQSHMEAFSVHRIFRPSWALN